MKTALPPVLKKRMIRYAGVMGVSLLGFDALANLIAKAAQDTEDEYES